jgi:hypothetical protein
MGLLVLLPLLVASAIACPPHCWAGSCNSSGACGSCSDGYWGPTCSQSCPEHCTFHRCDMKTGQCGSCYDDVWWGPTCANACPVHCNFGRCDKTTGLCGSSCAGDEWWGPTCANPCPEHCHWGRCDKKTGCCSCADGWAGSCTCSVSASCAAPRGVTCDWYSTCLGAAAQDCPFIDGTMGAKCEEYRSLEATLSPRGQKWSAYVRACLQNVLAKTVLLSSPSGRVDCSAATDAFLNDHVSCYLDGPISFCSLPYSDIGSIFLHGSSILFSKYWTAPLKSGAQLKFNCDVEFWEMTLKSLSSSSSVSPAYNSSACNSTAFFPLVNQTLYEARNWTATAGDASNVTKVAYGTDFILTLGTIDKLKYPLNTSLASAIVSSVIAKWGTMHPRCAIDVIT